MFGLVDEYRLVRRNDPIASFNALASANLNQGRRLALEILRDNGAPMSASDVRAEAIRLGHNDKEGETARRRIREMVAEGLLMDVHPDGGTGALVWFRPRPFLIKVNGKPMGPRLGYTWAR